MSQLQPEGQARRPLSALSPEAFWDPSHSEQGLATPICAQLGARWPGLLLECDFSLIWMGSHGSMQATAGQP